MLLAMLKINQPYIPDFTNPLGLLVHCHQKIENQLETLERASEILRSGELRSLPGAFAAIDAACAHFAVPGVKHTEDEEISLFPRLREHSGAGEEALAAMSELESQHKSAQRLHSDLDDLVARLPRDGSANPKDLDTLGELATQLTSLYQPHIVIENTIVFPIAERLLSSSELLMLGAEMRERHKDILAKLRGNG